MTKNRVLSLTGPNANLFGRREPAIYGTQTLQDLQQFCETTAADLGLSLTFEQNNHESVLHEGLIIEAIQRAMDDADGLIINPGGYTHSSIALVDALSMLCIPVIEVHISKAHARQEFRRHSLVSPVATTTIIGAGLHGYVLALRHLAYLLQPT